MNLFLHVLTQLTSGSFPANKYHIRKDSNRYYALMFGGRACERSPGHNWKYHWRASSTRGSNVSAPLLYKLLHVLLMGCMSYYLVCQARLVAMYSSAVEISDVQVMHLIKRTGEAQASTK